MTSVPRRREQEGCAREGYRVSSARSRCAAEYCAAHLGWAVVHCTSGDNMRSIEDIQAEVQEIVLKQLT